MLRKYKCAPVARGAALASCSCADAALYNRGHESRRARSAVARRSARRGLRGQRSEAEIRALLGEAAEAAEARDVGFFGDVIGDAYRDTRGNDREQLITCDSRVLHREPTHRVASRIDEVVLEGADAARAVVHAGWLGRAGANLSDGVNADLYRFDLELVNDGGEWQIIGAKWARALGD